MNVNDLNPDKEAKIRLSNLIRSHFGDRKMAELAAELDIEAGTLRGWARGDTFPAMNHRSLTWLTRLAKAVELTLPEILHQLYPEIEFTTQELTHDNILTAINDWTVKERSRVIVGGFLSLPMEDRMPLIQQLLGVAMTAA